MFDDGDFDNLPDDGLTYARRATRGLVRDFLALKPLWAALALIALLAL